MISLALATLLSMSAAQGPPLQPRTHFSACLSRFAKAKMADKMDEASFRAAAKTACAAEEEAFKASLVAFDTKMGAKRADAEEGATMEADDYLTSTTETYLVHTQPAKPQ